MARRKANKSVLGQFRNTRNIRSGRGPGRVTAMVGKGQPLPPPTAPQFGTGAVALPAPKPLGPPDRIRPLPGPPIGTYNPALDSQLGAARRGYIDYREDVQNQQDDSFADYGIARRDIRIENTRGQRDIGDIKADTWQEYMNQGGDLAQGLSRGRADLARSLGREEQDYGIARGRLDTDYGMQRGRQGEDYATANSQLKRQFANLGESQAEAGEAAGLHGGFAAQAARKRAENQGIEQQGIDRQNTRSLEDLDVGYERGGQELDRSIGRIREDNSIQGTRLGEDFGRDVGRLNQGLTRAGREIGQSEKRLEQDTGTAYGKLNVNYTRAARDRAIGLGRSGRELGAFTHDIGAARYYEARSTLPHGLPRYRPGKQGVGQGDPYGKNRNRRRRGTPGRKKGGVLVG